MTRSNRDDLLPSPSSASRWYFAAFGASQCSVTRRTHPERRAPSLVSPTRCLSPAGFRVGGVIAIYGRITARLSCLELSSRLERRTDIVRRPGLGERRGKSADI